MKKRTKLIKKLLGKTGERIHTMYNNMAICCAKHCYTPGYVLFCIYASYQNIITTTTKQRQHTKSRNMELEALSNLHDALYVAKIITAHHRLLLSVIAVPPRHWVDIQDDIHLLGVGYPIVSNIYNLADTHHAHIVGDRMVVPHR